MSKTKDELTSILKEHPEITPDLIEIVKKMRPDLYCRAMFMMSHPVEEWPDAWRPHDMPT